MLSAGSDKGNFLFERETLLKHLKFYIDFLEKTIEKPDFTIQLTPIADRKGSIQSAERIIPAVTTSITKYPVKINETKENFTYYSHLRAVIFLKISGEEHMIIDGGFTDWSQKLLNNKKERMFTSGLGLEYLIKLLKG